MNTFHKTITAAQPYQRPTGLVVIFEGNYAGWIDELRDPHHWVPGCLAVSPSCDVYEARGGDDFGGATKWKKLEQNSCA